MSETGDLAATQVSVEEMKDGLSEYLRRVEVGEVLVIAKAGKPVAELRPIAPASAGPDGVGSETGEPTGHSEAGALFLHDAGEDFNEVWLNNCHS
jgi:prevent-host-death family protein